MDRPIIICGLGRMGTRVLECLHAAGLPVVVIDNLAQPGDLHLQQAPLIQGDFRRREVWEGAEVANARAVFILTRDDLVNISTALLVRSLNPQARIVLRLFNQELLPRLEQAVENVFALSSALLAAPLLALTALTGQGLAAFSLREGEERQIIEVPIVADSRWCGQTIQDILSRHAVVVLANRSLSGRELCLLEVDSKAPLQAGDRLVVCGSRDSLSALISEAAPAEEPPLLWAAWYRRMLRVVHRTLLELDPAVLLCTAVLVLVVTTSTLVLHLSVERYRLPDALFRTISIMATGAWIAEDELIDHPGMKVFVSVLRIVGMALTAAFTAILTQYLLRARLGGAFEMRRIPDSGHVIVCGLGATGYQTVEKLTQSGHQVVAIEHDSANRFVRRARKLGAAVMIGDATLPEVLREAHAGSAHAVIAATDNDLSNLAVTLMVRQWKPQQRVVLVLEDTQLARMLREAAHVQLALSIPLLAAPAFLAAMYGSRVLTVFQLSSRLFAVVDLPVGPLGPFVDCPLERIAGDYCLCPLAAWSANGMAVSPLWSTPLKPGDRLVAILALPDLEKLLRVQEQAVAVG